MGVVDAGRLERGPERRIRHRIAPGLGARRRCVRRAARRRVGVRRGRSRPRAAVSSPVIPVAVVAFSDEEGARFGVACVGSQLSTGALTRRTRAGSARQRRHHAGRCADATRVAIPSTSAPTRHAGRPRRRLRRTARRAGPRAGPGRQAGRGRVGDLAARSMAVHASAARPTTPAPPGWSTGATRC